MNNTCNDLTEICNLTEEAIVNTLRSRFLENKIYTRIRNSTLVHVNPYQDSLSSLQELSERYLSEYKETSTATHKSPQQLDPHIFQHVNQAYFHLRRTGHDQSIVFRGATASGKTQMRQAALFHLMTLSSSNNKKTERVQDLVRRAYRVLEIFGHCKTLANSNASRFGSYVELQFNERGRMIGAKFLDYTLDRSRITQPQASEETNYNVLYKVAQQQQLSPFLYNKEAARTNDDDQDLLDLKSDMKALGIGKTTWQELVNILTAILRIGNIQFGTRQQDVVVKNPTELEAVAQLLGVEPRDIENVLTYQTKLVQREMATVVLTAEQAAVQRDQLAQTLYTLLFSWIVEAINRKLCKPTFQNFIGLVDFPGSSTAQSFDQFCIHFTNEKLQQFMLSHQFEYNAQVYSEKPIDRDPVTFSFASGLQLATNLATCTTAEQIEAQLTECKKDPCLTIKRSGTFCIQHFSGPVTYNVQEIASKNTETLNADYVALFKNDDCTNQLVKQLFSQKVVNESQTKTGAIISAQQSSKPHRSPSTRRKNKRESSSAKQQNQTRFGQVADAIDELISTLQETQLWWVVCLRPNDLNLPKSCDAKKLAAQVRMFQLTDLALRARHEYLVRISIDEFCERYKNLIEETSISDYGSDVSPSDQCYALMGSFNWSVRMMVVGRDHVYLDGNAWTILENQLRSAEKEEQRKARSAARGLAFDEDDNNPPMSPYDVAGSVVDGSVFTDEHGHTHCYTDTTSVRTSFQLASDDTIKIPKEKRSKTKKKRPTIARGLWVTLTWMSTWWIPSFLLGCVGGMRRADIRMAWREKLTLCILIFILCAAMIWFICFFGQLLCPHEDIYSQSELQAKSNKDNAYIAIRGEVFDLTSFAPRHWAPEVIPSSALFQYAGQDVSDLFPVQVSALCDGNNAPIPPELTLDTRINITDSNAKYHDFRYFRDDYRPDWYFEQMMAMRRNYRLGFMGYDMDDIRHQALNPVQIGGINAQRRWAVLHGSVYDLTSYMLGGVELRAPGEPAVPPSNNTVGADFIDNSITELFRQLAGTDITAHFDALPMDAEKRTRQLTCLRNLFFVGRVDNRRSLKCLFSEYLLLLITAFLCSVILFKFLAALCLVPAKAQDEEFDKFIVCQIPCYTEGEESLRKTIDSVAALKYDDKRKLLFLVADGMVVGSGNDRSTPRIVLDILGVDPSIDPEPVSFLSLGPGQKQHNMAKVYSGLYEHAGHVVPYIVVVKVGTPNERQKSGNRGKRDSQMVLMRFLNKVHYDAPMTPLELVIYHELKNVIGVHPSFYEFVLMVDADTEVMPDALNRMVARFVQDPKIIGLCGETMLSNEKDTWVTMIQVYEYYISHYLSKAFESLFGSVTCLPGCFCMYRIRSTTNRPLLVSHAVINDYAENNVDTLHKKNLLHLGEDRYLTTLILKHFPTYKTKFTPDVACMTNAPDRWPVLLSQRRRWINSTVHNLGELMFLPELCGFCCFSMRFVVMLDLLSTLVMPAVVCYLVYLLYQLSTSTSQVPLISIITLAGVYGLQAIIFILRRKWEHIGWMIVYILAIPVFSFLVPLYAFWHFDDFSWGNTRIVLGDRGQKKAVGPEEGEFDPQSIPTKRWAEHERDMWEHQSADDEKVFRSPRQYASSRYLGSVGNIHLPTESEIAREIEKILQEADLAHLTKKQVRDQLSDIFEIDMSYKRDFINKCIESCLHMYK